MHEWLELSDGLPKASMPDSDKHLLEKLWNRSCRCCTCSYMMTRLLKFYSTVLWPCLKPAIFCEQLLSLGLGLVENNSEHNLAGMAD